MYLKYILCIGTSKICNFKRLFQISILTFYFIEKKNMYNGRRFVFIFILIQVNILCTYYILLELERLKNEC